MDIFQEIEGIKNSDELKELKHMRENCGNMERKQIKIIDNIHYLIGKYKCGVETTLIDCSATQNAYYENELKHTRIGLRYTRDYGGREPLLTLKQIKKELRKAKVYNTLKKSMKPEGQVILKNIRKELNKQKDFSNLLVDVEIIRKVNIPQYIIDNSSIESSSKSKEYPCFKYSGQLYGNIEINTGSYEETEIGDDMEGYGLAKFFYSDIKSVYKEYKEELDKLNNQIDSVNSDFNTTFAKYLLIMEI